MNLLSDSQADHFNLDGFAGVLDKLGGNVVDADWFSHIQHENFTCSADGACLNHKLYRLGNGHEVARNTAMRHCYRTTFCDLITKGRKHAASRTENVTKSDRDEFSRRSSKGKIGGQSFGESFGVSEDADGIGGFVGGDIDEHTDVISLCRLEESMSTEHVCLVRLARIALSKGRCFKAAA